MAALSKDRATPERTGALDVIPVAAATKIYAGALVCRNAAGDAVPGSVATTLKAAGRAEEQADNTTGAAGDVSVKTRRGTFRFDNSAAGDLIAKADIGATAYIVDDQTVAKTNGSNTRSAAGKIRDVDAIGVWVEIG